MPGIRFPFSLTPNKTPLTGQTNTLQPDQPVSIRLDDYQRAIKRRDGTFDFGVSEKEWRKYNMVELIQDKASRVYNTGKLLVEKMEEIRKSGQVYYWKIDPKKRYTPEQQKEYEAR